MGKEYAALDDRLIQLIGGQRLFFVATAPLGASGHINLSPKGYDTFRVLDPLEYRRVPRHRMTEMQKPQTQSARVKTRNR